MMTSFFSSQRLLTVFLLSFVLLTIGISAECTAYGRGQYKDRPHGADQREAAAVHKGNVMPYVLGNGRNGKGKHVQVVATGYTAGVESTGKKPGHPQYGITYSGVKVRRGAISTIAADPKVFPIGTLLYVPGYGYAIVADTGSAIKGCKIDLYFETKKQVFKQWGKRRVVVQVLKQGSGKLTEASLNALNEAVAAEERIQGKLFES